jgi:hypothetical protein
MSNMLETFIISILQITARQILVIFGLYFVAGFLLSHLEHENEKIYLRLFGWRAILWTGWIGTPIHELSHVIFAKLFHHRVTEISLFHPDQHTGRLGHVSHSYNPRSLYQQLGNFFIGAAPLIGGSCALLLLLYGLVPHAQQIFDATTNYTTISSLTQTLGTIISLHNFTSFKFWIFIYTSLCIVSHIAPSRADIKNMWHGFLWLIGFLLILNSIVYAFGGNISTYIVESSRYSGILAAIFIYSLCLSFLHFIIVRIFLAPFLRLK